MSLGLASFITRGSLVAASGQMALVSRNIGAGDLADSSRKILDLVTADFGGVRAAGIRRAGETSLREALSQSRGEAAAMAAYAEGLDRLDPASQTVDDPAGLPARLGAFLADLTAFAAAPSELQLGAQAAQSASLLTQSLNEKAAGIETMRRETSQSLAASVNTINGLLAQFQTVNDSIVAGLRRGADMTDALDARDRLINALSQETGVRVLQREGGDVALYSDGGATLFERTARTVALVGGPGTEQVAVDGVFITGLASAMPSREGRIAGLVRVRDEAAPAYLRQLDALAAGLIQATAEASTTAGNPDRPGLFTWAGAPAIPSAGAGGVAASIRTSALLDVANGGGLSRLRDGGLSEPDEPSYISNPGLGAGYSARLLEMLGQLEGAQNFAPADGYPQEQTLAARTADMTGWLARARQSAQGNATQADVAAASALTALSQSAGISLDDELARMLDIENAYAASSRLLATIDAMFATLLEAAR